MANPSSKTTTFSNGKFKSQTICNEEKTDGFRVFWYESGKMKSAAEYKHEKLDGLYTEWYENGTKSSEINYFDGVKHGSITLWHKNSQMKLKGQYKYGNLDGLHTTWHNNKSIKSVSKYRQNRLYGSYTAQHKNGQIKFTADYRNGRRVIGATFTAWHENGNESIKINYRDGHRHGLCTLWHKDGLKRSEVVYSNGKMNGLWVSWYKTGQIRHAILFKNCRKKSETTWYSNGNIKSNTELGAEYCSSRLNKFSDVSYDDWVDYYLPHTFGSNLLSGGIRYPTLMTYWYESGQKSEEIIQYYYDDSVICWHENGQKSMKAGKKKGDPTTYWDEHGVKVYECILDFDYTEDYDCTHHIKFFDNNEMYLAAVNQTERFDKFIEWEFFNNNDNKVYNYKHNYLKDAFMDSDKLWDIWLSSESKELVKVLKSIENHKSTFCKI